MSGGSNTEHFFVASQDAQLRGKLQRLPAGASIFASVNDIHLEQPSAEQRLAAGQVESRHVHLFPLESSVHSSSFHPVVNPGPFASLIHRMQ